MPLVNGSFVLAVTVAVLCPLLSAHAGVIRHDRDDADHRALAADPAFDPVGQLTYVEDGSLRKCSATLIDDNWVLTAGHCVAGDDGFGAGQSAMSFRLDDGATFAGVEWFSHPQWVESGRESFSGYDIGLVRLDQTVEGVTPASLYTQTDERGQIGTIVGYGLTGTGLSGYEPGTGGTKRAGQNVLDVFGGAGFSGGGGPPTLSPNVLLIDFDNPDNPRDSRVGSTSPLDLEYLPAPGDSGGGMFLERDGQARLAGVHSFIRATDGEADGDFGDQAGIVRVSSFLEWIDSNVFALRADFDGDGDVDAFDLSLWQQGFGTTTATSAVALIGDADGDGDVDAFDLSIWQTEFGSARLAPSPIIAIPEPAAGLVLAAALLLGRPSARERCRFTPTRLSPAACSRCRTPRG